MKQVTVGPPEPGSGLGGSRAVAARAAQALTPLLVRMHPGILRGLKLVRCSQDRASMRHARDHPPLACRRRLPELTRSGDIKLNARVLMRLLVVAISFADDATARLEFCLCGRVGCRGGRLALVPVRICRSNFQALKFVKIYLPPSQSTIFRAGVIDSTGAEEWDRNPIQITAGRFFNMTDDSDQRTGSGERVNPHWTYQFIDLSRIEAGELIVPGKIDSDEGRKFAALNLIQSDLRFSLECFSDANKLGIPDSENARSKALIFSAVVAYARPFKTGVREIKLDKNVFAS